MWKIRNKRKYLGDNIIYILQVSNNIGKKSNPGLDDVSCFVMSRGVSDIECALIRVSASLAAQTATIFRLLTSWRLKQLEPYFRWSLTLV